MSSTLPSGFPPPPGAPPRPGGKSWFVRHWIWLLVAAGLCVVVLFGLLFGAVEYSFRASIPYQEGVRRASSSAAVAERLGSPLKFGRIVSGSINVSNSDGNAAIVIPVWGPRGSGSIRVEGTRKNNRWTFSVLELDLDNSSDVIPLLEPAPGTPITPDSSADDSTT